MVSTLVRFVRFEAARRTGWSFAAVFIGGVEHYVDFRDATLRYAGMVVWYRDAKIDRQ